MIPAPRQGAPEVTLPAALRSSTRTIVLPDDQHRPARVIPAQRPAYARDVVTTQTPAGHHLPAGTVGQHAAGMLRQLEDLTGMPGPAQPDDVDALTRDLTMAMQGYAATADVTSYADLIPFLAKTLVTNGWVQ